MQTGVDLMKRKRWLLALVVALLALAPAGCTVLREVAKPPTRAGDVHSWPVPTEAQLERLKAQKGIRIPATDLQKLAKASVVRVVDGDTVELKLADGKQEKARLLNVNTPETVDPRRPVEEYGREASNFSKSMLTPGRPVFYKFDVEQRDKYGRMLVHLYLEDGTWYNALLIRAGYAQVMTISPNVSAASFFKELEAQARKEGIGLWQVPAYQKQK
jgi:endonuclease YncB( thermonuclease family)